MHVMLSGHFKKLSNFLLQKNVRFEAVRFQPN